MNLRKDRDCTATEQVQTLTAYWSTYADAYERYHDFTPQTLLDDALYSIGISISKKYTAAQGYDLFKKDLLEYLKKEIGEVDNNE